MSTNFRTSTPIMAEKLFDGRLAPFGIKERLSKDRGKRKRCLTDGRRNFLWVYIDGDGSVGCLTVYLPNGNPSRILSVIVDVFGVEIHSEHEPQYWGVDTQEEWNAFQRRISQEHEDEFYCDILQFLKRKSCGIKRGTNGMTMAKIARKLVKKQPALILLENKDKFIKRIKDVFFGDHVEWVTLD